MDDERVVGAELNRLAATDPLDPIDPQAMLTRGRRSRRNRRLLGAGGVVSAVAAVAVGASLLPGSAVSTPEPNVASPSQKTAVSSDFTAVPGVPRGEMGSGNQLALKEANRRCALRYPEVKRPIQSVPNWYAGMAVPFQLQKGDRFAECIIPGGDKPSAALVAAARRDPIPATAAGLLRNCSVQFWTDLTNWRIIVSDTQPGLAAALVARSPSGKSTVTCALMLTREHEPYLGPASRMLRTNVVGRNTFGEAFMSPSGGQQNCSRNKCDGWLNVSTGRIPANIAKIRIEPVSGGSHEIAVREGWFALAYLAPDPKGRPDAKATAYDKAGKVLQVVNG